MNSLSIVIPTFNRAKFLDFLLEKHISIFRQHSIQVFIFNNASSDETEKVIEKWKKIYNLITSETNHDNVFIADKSIENALKLSNTKYRWLLGDTYYLSPELVQHVSEMISKNNEIDLYVLNLNGIIKDISSSLFYEENEMLANFGTVMACVGCQIYNEKIINANNFKRYSGTNYVQLGIILEYISNNNFCSSWVQELSVTSLKNPKLEKRNWSHGKEVLEIAAKNWTEFIFSLPDCYSTKSKLMAIKNFGRQTNIFTIKGLVLMRARGNLTYANYRKFSKEINLIVKYPSVVIIISIIPIIFLKIFCLVYTGVFKRTKIKQWCFNE
jgi:glycosyltransferase involved in cell wall biosynthesis